jgi:hypothetical protein
MINKVDLEKLEAALKAVIADSQQLVHVIHDNNGERHFYSNDEVAAEDTKLVDLEVLADVNKTLKTILKLKKGFEASRVGLAGNWVTKRLAP